MTVAPVRLAVGTLALTALSFFWFPGHTILQSDTQIYLPMLEHAVDPSVLARDAMAVRPHMAFTLYDEMLLLLRRATGMSFEPLLLAQEFVYRALGIIGLFLVSTALSLSPASAFVVSSLVSLGAAVMGPSVLTVEYEPVPRGFALPFLWLSLGFLGHARWRPAAVAATVAFAFHPPTALAFCGVLFGTFLWQRRYSDLPFLFLGPLVLLLAVVGQPSAPERTPLFATIDPALEQLQRMRASYNWVSLWIAEWVGHYALMLGILAAAFWRVRASCPPVLQVFVVTLTVLGISSVPISLLLLERWKWIMVPQFQPGRYLLFVTFFAVLLSAIAAVKAAEQRRWTEAIVFGFVPFIVPIENNLAHLLWPDSVLLWQRLALAIAGACLLVFLFRWHSAAISFTMACFLLLPWLGHVQNFAPLHTRELDQLSAWARTETPKDAVFQFVDFGRSLEPGVFRARSLRALYVDWKSGGQVNFMKPYSVLWQQRWEQVGDPKSLASYRSLGIEYVVFRAGASGLPRDAAPVFQNRLFVVYRVP